MLKKGNNMTFPSIWLENIFNDSPMFSRYLFCRVHFVSERKLSNVREEDNVTSSRANVIPTFIPSLRVG